MPDCMTPHDHCLSPYVIPGHANSFSLTRSGNMLMYGSGEMKAGQGDEKGRGGGGGGEDRKDTRCGDGKGKR